MPRPTDLHRSHWLLDPRVERSQTMLPLHTILHPTDFSETCESAFRVATALARDYGARLILLHVMPLPDLAYGEGLIVAEEFYDHDTPREKLARLAESAPGIETETLL